MGVQIINYGAIIRIDTDGNVLLLTKSQVRDIEVVHNDTVRINLGEGVLREVLIKLSDVTHPAGLPDVAALRDHISHFLDYANKYELEEIGVSRDQLAELGAIKQLMQFYHGSWQTLWNYQQTQINMLLAIENILHSSKALTQEIVDNVILQTLESKNIVTQVAAGNVHLEAIQDSAGNMVTQVETGNEYLEAIQELTAQSNTKQQEQIDMLDVLQALSTQCRDGQTFQTAELNLQTNHLAVIESQLETSFNVHNSSNSNIAEISTKMSLLLIESNSQHILQSHMKDALLEITGNLSDHNLQFIAMNLALQDIKTLLATP